MVNTSQEKPPLFFYLEWVVLNVIAIVIAWYTALTLIALIAAVLGDTIQVAGKSHITEDFLFAYVLLPMIGLMTGIFQYTLLRRYLPRMAWWIAATLLGWSLPFLAGSVLTPLLAMNSSTFSAMLGMLLIGATIALPQWWMLRQRVRHASWWILAFGFGWWMIGILNRVTSEPFAVLLAIALLPTIATALACWLLLDWLPGHEFNGAY